MKREESERERLIGKLSDSMDPDNATVFVDRVIQEAVAEARAENELLHRLWTEAIGKAERLETDRDVWKARAEGR